MNMDGSGSATKIDTVKNQNIKVFVRPRPLTKDEKERNQYSIVNILRHRIGVVTPLGKGERSFNFDEVFNFDTSQAEVYHVVVSPLIKQIILGYSCTVFAYGQTGSGKTHTMTGPNFSLGENYKKDNVGLIPRAIHHLFGELLSSEKIEYTVRVSFMEIYNEDIRDLLATESCTPLKVYDDPENRGSVQVRGLSENTVCTPEEALEWLQFGLNQRRTASTLMNRESSRSHAVYTICLHTREVTIEGEQLMKTGKLHMVDLAGSECVAKSGATGSKATETGKINMSLFTLGKVIKSLAQNCSHIPYRDSKLTRFLQDSLGGRTKTHMIATISPVAESVDETLSTIDYAHSARFVYNCPVVNENRKQVNVMNNLKDEITSLRKELSAARTGENGFFINKDNYEKLCQEHETSRKKMEEIQKRDAALIKRIEQLEDYQKIKEQDFNNILASFRKTKAHLEVTKNHLNEKNELFEQEKFLSEHYEKREHELSNTAKTLINVCESSTKHGEIYHKKYINLCDQNINTAQAAKSIFSTTNNCFNEILLGLQKFNDGQGDRLNQLEADTELIVQERNYDAVAPLLEYRDKTITMQESEKYASSIFDSISESLTTIDFEELKTQTRKKDEVVQSNVENCANVIKGCVSREDLFFKRHLELQNKFSIGMRELEQKMQANFLSHRQMSNSIKAIEASVIEVENSVKQIKESVYEVEKSLNKTDIEMENQMRQFQNLNYIHDEFSTLYAEYYQNKPAASIQESFNEELYDNPTTKAADQNFKDALKVIEKNCNVTQANVQNGKTKLLSHFVGLGNILEKRNIAHKEQINKIKDKMEQVESNISNKQQGIAFTIQTKLKQCSQAQKNYLDEMKNFISKFSYTMQTQFQQVKFDVHAGDTPDKKVFKFPKNIAEPTPKETLFQKFKNFYQPSPPVFDDEDDPGDVTY